MWLPDAGYPSHREDTALLIIYTVGTLLANITGFERLFLIFFIRLKASLLI